MPHFYNSFHIKEKFEDFFNFFMISFPFFFLVRNKKIKRSGFCILQLTRVFMNVLQLKQLRKIKYMCEYCLFLKCDLVS